jgi:hypothetical protein
MVLNLKTSDLVSALEWLKGKHLLNDEPTAIEIKSGLAWMKRHLIGIHIITMRKGHWLVSASEADKLYKQYQSGLSFTVRNKARAAAKLNAKRSTFNIFKETYSLDTKEARASFYEEIKSNW